MKEDPALTAERSEASQKTMACITVLYLLAKIKPALLVPHAAALQPYLGTKVSVSELSLVLLE